MHAHATSDLQGNSEPYGKCDGASSIEATLETFPTRTVLISTELWTAPNVN